MNRNSQGNNLKTLMFNNFNPILNDNCQAAFNSNNLNPNSPYNNSTVKSTGNNNFNKFPIDTNIFNDHTIQPHLNDFNAARNRHNYLQNNIKFPLRITLKFTGKNQSLCSYFENLDE